MIYADMHTHTHYSHGRGSPGEMLAAANRKNLALLSFTEHSPRPEGFDYTHEYRDRLNRHFEDYIKETRALKELAQRQSKKGVCQVLAGMEMDWLRGGEEFVRKAAGAHDFDFLLGSVHFLDRWGFDDNAELWKGASQEECDKRYELYFELWMDMIASGLFQIAAHPDIIKIYSVERFHIWLDKPESREITRRALLALRHAGMAMEVSSAGLRKACREIYPCPQIMQMAAELELPISMASDAHCPEDVASGFDNLEKYVRQFGYEGQLVFDHGRRAFMPF